MTYSPNIPQPTDIPSDSQADLLNNFQSLNTLFSINHMPLTDVSPQAGYHTRVYLNNVLGADPGLASPVTSIYSKSTAGGNELFFQNNTLASNVKQLTGSIIIETGTDGQGGAYQVFQTPWGIKFFTGQTSAFNGSRNFTFSGAQVFGASIYASIATPYGAGAFACSFSPNAGLGTYNMQTASNMPLRWLAITS